MNEDGFWKVLLDIDPRRQGPVFKGLAELHILRFPGTSRAQVPTKEWVHLRFTLLRGPAEYRSWAIEK